MTIPEMIELLEGAKEHHWYDSSDGKDCPALYGRECNCGAAEQISKMNQVIDYLSEKAKAR